MPSARDLSRAVSGSVKSLPQEENLSSAWLGCNFGAADQLSRKSVDQCTPTMGFLLKLIYKLKYIQKNS